MSTLNKIPEEPTPIDIAQVLKHYRVNFYPIFAYATAMEANISIQMLNELRNCFDHLARAETGDSPDANIAKAKNHIDRACLDCAKIAWVACKKEVERLFQAFTPKEYAVLDGGNLWKQVSGLHKTFYDKSHEARLGETEKMDKGVFEAVNLYFEAINIGQELQELISNKANDLSHAKSLVDKGTLMHNLKWAIIGAFFGAILGVVLTLLTSQAVSYFSPPKTKGNEAGMQRNVVKEGSRDLIKNSSANKETRQPIRK